MIIRGLFTAVNNDLNVNFSGVITVTNDTRDVGIWTNALVLGVIFRPAKTRRYQLTVRIASETCGTQVLKSFLLSPLSPTLAKCSNDAHFVFSNRKFLLNIKQILTKTPQGSILQKF